MKKVKTRITIPGLLALLLLMAACSQSPEPTEQAIEQGLQLQAQNFVVNSFNDGHDANPGNGICADANGHCTLRAAIEEANALAGYDKIDVPAGLYQLTLGQLEITDDVIVMGSRQGSTIVDARQNSRVFLIDNSGLRDRKRIRVELHFLEIRNGHSFNAAGIFNAGGRVLLQHSRVSGNVADNEAAAIANAHNGIMELRHSSVSDNGDGYFPELGGIVNYKNSAMYIYNSTIANNEAVAAAGIWNEGYMNVVNSTISGNRSMSHFPGGLFNTSENGHAALNNVTIAFNENNLGSYGNPAGWASGIMNSSFGSTLLIGNSIVANNINHQGSEVDCSGTISSVGYNLIGDTTGCTLVGDLTGNLTGVDPLLQPLAMNGGATQTHAIDKTSPARNKGNPAIPTGVGATCQPLDQRNMTRGVGPAGRCDMGAFELHGGPGVIVWKP